ICSILLITQSLVMLILISQSSFFGQLMFVSSLAFSWVYNLWVWTFDKETLQREILKKVLKPEKFTKFILKTRTSTLVFAALALQLRDPVKIGKVFGFPDTPVWKKWKKVVIDRLSDGRELEFDDPDWTCDDLEEKEMGLLKVLLGDAMVAYKLFKK
ncbi:hypothetical protein EDC04DRAFT_2554554, partial [Pisolithus marmoratus]